MKPDQPRLSVLLDSVVDESCSGAERQEFVELVEGDKTLTADYVEQMRMHSLLQWQSEQLTAFATQGNDGPAALLLAAQNPSCEPPRSASRYLKYAAVIALVACGVWAWRYFQPRQRADVTNLAVAEIVKEDLVDWSNGSTALSDYQKIVPGRLKMKSGALTLRFRSGATLTVFGDVSMRIESDMLVRLEKGQATAHVPQWARGFTVETPDAKVVDLGTRFGVDARIGGLTDIVVFEGEVDVTPAIGEISTPTRLTQGEAARVDNLGSLSRIVEVHRDNWGENWSTDDVSSDRSVFESIRDNIKPDDSAKYYEIIPRGLIDDAPAYVDRRHQWNGLTAAGLPEFLRRADYVRTFNDYKYHNELQIEIELSEPAIVYIFADDRVPTPEWLSTQFENTGAKIGLDEGPWPEINPSDPRLSTAVGAGNSVDNVFSVWRRRCDAAETLILGATGEPKEACAIYGIAAQPLE